MEHEDINDIILLYAYFVRFTALRKEYERYFLKTFNDQSGFIGYEEIRQYEHGNIEVIEFSTFKEGIERIKEKIKDEIVPNT